MMSSCIGKRGRRHVYPRDILPREGSLDRRTEESVVETVITSATDLGPINAMVERAWSLKGQGNGCGVHNTQHTAQEIKPGFLHESAWDAWLWGETPLEEVPSSIMMNRMHLLGLLIAR